MESRRRGPSASSSLESASTDGAAPSKRPHRPSPVLRHRRRPPFPLPNLPSSSSLHSLPLPPSPSLPPPAEGAVAASSRRTSRVFARLFPLGRSPRVAGVPRPARSRSRSRSSRSGPQPVASRSRRVVFGEELMRELLDESVTAPTVDAVSKVEVAAGPRRRDSLLSGRLRPLVVGSASPRGVQRPTPVAAAEEGSRRLPSCREDPRRAGSCRLRLFGGRRRRRLRRSRVAPRRAWSRRRRLRLAGAVAAFACPGCSTALHGADGRQTPTTGPRPLWPPRSVPLGVDLSGVEHRGAPGASKGGDGTR